MPADRCLVLAVALTALLAVPARAEPRDDLLRYLPDDIGFCLLGQDLRERLIEGMASPFAERAARSAPGRQIAASREWRQVRQMAAALEKQLGMSWKEARDEFLGGAFLFAYRPGPAGKPEQEQGLFLLRAASPRPLAALISRLNEVQKQTGELKAREDREYRGVAYVRRVEAKEVNYYLIRGPVLLFTSSEPLLRRAIDSERNALGATGSVFAHRLRDVGMERAPLVLLVNPRAFDDAIAARAVEDANVRPFAALWKAVQGIGLALDVKTDLRLTLSVRVSPKELPAAARPFLPAVTTPSAVWASIPDDALVAVAGRVPLTQWYELLAGLLSRESRDKFEQELDRTLGAVLGKSVVRDVLPAIGPDWGAFVTAPPAESKGWLPAFTAAIRLERGDGDEPIDQAIVQAIHSGAQLAVLSHNKTHPGRPLALRTTQLDGTRIRSLRGDEALPPGIQPSFALKGGYLVLASSLAGVGSFRPPAAAEPASSVPLLRVSLRALRDYLRQRREPLTARLTRPDGLSAEQVGRQLDAVQAGLELFDRVELRQVSRAELLSFVLIVQPAAPLRQAP